MKLIKCLFCLCLCLNLWEVSFAQDQKFLNLSFESSTPSGQAKVWFQGGQGYEIAVDTTIAYSGKNSLQIKHVSQGDFGVATSSFPVEAARGKHLRYIGYIRTDSITSGYAGLWWRVDGKSGVIGFDNMNDRGPSGTTPWTKYEIELDIDTTAVNVSFGVLVPGKGTAWFDNLQIELDGKRYEQTPPEPYVPTDIEISWLRKQSISFDTAEPRETNKDLRPLKSLIGNARIVALGEGTHGTSEFFEMKHRITKYLAEEMGFTIFAIEANMPETRRINEYVLTGKGDPKEALDGIYFWTWNTQEVFNMIEWMRQFNTSGKGRIEFRGFDMQYPKVAMDNVQSFIEKAEPQYFDSLKQVYNNIREIYDELRGKRTSTSQKYQTWYDTALSIYRHIKRNKGNYLKSFNSMTVEQALQDARIIVQSAEAHLPDKPSRDESMAENVEWILSQSPPNSKIVLWAHNGHVSKSGTRYESMGKFLAERFKKQMVVFGFGFHKGKYTAIGDKGLGTYSATPSEPGSVEWAFHQTGLPRLMYDLRNASKAPNSKWLDDKMEFRSIGAVATDWGFYNTNIAKEFDVLIYFDETSDSNLLSQ